MNLGSAYRYFPLSSPLPVVLPPFIVQLFIMKRHNSHLPTLNALYLQNQHYKKHKQHLERIKRSKSSYEYTNNPSNVSSQAQQGDLKYRVNSQVSQLSQKMFDVSMISSPDRQVSQSPQKIGLRVLKPYEKRKMTERNQQNIRILLALQSSNPSKYRYDHQGEQARQILRNRISKYIKEGSSIRYKFKKSLAQIQRRKQANKQSLKIQKAIIPQQIRQQLEVIQRRKESSQSTNTRQQTKQTSCSDIYTYNFVQPHRYGACVTNTQETEKKHKQNGSRKVKTQWHQISSTAQGEFDTFANKYQALKQSLQLRMKSRSKADKGSAILVKQASTLVLKPKALRQPISDIEIITLPPITKRQ